MNVLKQLLSARLTAGKRTALPVVLATLFLATVSASAQQKLGIAGDYLGTLGPLHVKLHLKVDPTGSVTGTLDSPDQGANGIPCADFHLDGQDRKSTRLNSS